MTIEPQKKLMSHAINVSIGVIRKETRIDDSTTVITHTLCAIDRRGDVEIKDANTLWEYVRGVVKSVYGFEV